MNFTYRNHIWKGETTNSIVPTNSRPFTNDDPNLIHSGHTPGKPNPIKHWRKQLRPYYATKSSKQVSIDMINAPNSVVYVNPSQSYDCSTITNNSQLLKENITMLNHCNGIKYVADNSNNVIKCIGGSHNVRRSANTNLSPNYYRNYSKYLQSKCRTYEANKSLGTQKDDVTYQSSKCSSLHNKCDKPVIYKPSNIAFSEQGSVSASANTLRRRNQAITNNSSSLKTAYGLSYVHAVFDDVNSAYKVRYVKGDNSSNTLCYQQFKSCPKSS